MLLKIFNRTSHCKATNDFMQKICYVSYSSSIYEEIARLFFCANPKNPVRNFGKPSSQNFQKTQFSAKNSVQNLPKLSFFHKISQKIAKFVLKFCNFGKTQFKISKNPVPKMQKLSFSEI